MEEFIRAMQASKPLVDMGVMFQRIPDTQKPELIRQAVLQVPEEQIWRVRMLAGINKQVPGIKDAYNTAIRERLRKPAKPRQPGSLLAKFLARAA